MNRELIAKSSPLYEYWQTNQDSKNETQRLSIINKNSPASVLFENEPYKWENLYQSIIRELYRGDKESVFAMKVLLETITQEEKIKLVNKIKNYNLLSREIISLISENSLESIPRKFKIFRFLRILVAIYTNPYGIELKSKKKHLYEKTGSLMHTLRSYILIVFNKIKALNN